MAGPLSKYSFINAKLRARISKILPDEKFNRLEQAQSLDEALALLRETPFAGLEEVYSATGDLKRAELERYQAAPSSQFHGACRCTAVSI